MGMSRNRQRKKRASVRSSVLGRFGHHESDAYSSEHSIIVPLNYAQILGLRGREIWLDPLITAAHDELFAMDLDPSYSSVARLGKEKILYAAREGLRAVRGRVSLIHPDTRLEPALLPGVLALLEQAGEYELVIQLADHGDRINPKDLHPAPSRSTLRDFQRDVALSKALAHCGLAKKALEGEQVALGCARLDEALHILQDSCFPGEEPLAVDLQANINTALNDLKSDAVLDYLRQPLDLAEVSLRNQALQALKSMLQASSTDGIGADYVSQALAALKAEEICRVFDWDRLARDAAARNKLPWWRPGILPKVGLAHLIAGFVARKPRLVATAGHLLAAGRSEGDVSVPLAVCEVLLGKPNDALDILKEDEHLGASLRGKAGLSKEVKVGGNAFAKAMHAIPPFPDRDGIMDFIRLASAEAEDERGDLLPGLCLFVEQWMSRIAFPQVRDTREMPPSSSLSEYFDDPATAAYFEAQENPSALSFLGNQIERIFLRGRRFLSSAMGQNGTAQTLSKVGLVVAFGLLASGVVVGFGKKQLSTSLVDADTASSPTLRSSSAKTKTRKTTAEKGKTTSMLTKEAARQLIKDWLVSLDGIVIFLLWNCMMVDVIDDEDPSEIWQNEFCLFSCLVIGKFPGHQSRGHGTSTPYRSPCICSR